MSESPWFIPLLFLCAAALSVMLLAAGSILALYIQHITRTGKPPIGSVPGMQTLRRAFAREADDEEEQPPIPERNRTGP